VQCEVTSQSEASCPIRSLAMDNPRIKRDERTRLAWGLFLVIGGLIGILGLVIYVASHHAAHTRTQSIIEQATFFSSVACVLTGATLVVLDRIMLRVWLIAWGIGVIAMMVFCYIWNSHFGWYNWGETFQSRPFFRQVVIPALLMGAIVNICTRMIQRFGTKQNIIGSRSGK
jgi:hypothetical protein